MSYLEKALKALGGGVASEHNKKDKTPSQRLTRTNPFSPSLCERSERSEVTPHTPVPEKFWCSVESCLQIVAPGNSCPVHGVAS